MRYRTGILFFLLFIFMLPSVAFAADPIQLFFNGKALQSEVSPKIVNDYTVVPVRLIADQLGADIQWDENERKVTVQKTDVEIVMYIDNPQVTVNGKSVIVDVAPFIEDDFTMLPLRFVGEQLGIKFSWDEFTRSVFMYSDVNLADVPAQPVIAQHEQPQAESVTPILPAKPEKPALPAYEPVNEQPVQPTKPTTEQSDSGHNELQAVETTAEQVIIKTRGRAESKLFYLDNPSRAVIDLSDTAIAAELSDSLSKESGQLTSNHPLIERIRYAQNSKDPLIVRIVLDLKQPAKFTLSKNETSGDIILQTAAEQPQKPEHAGKYKVVIDAGHGGDDPGTVSFNGTYEKNFTLSVAEKVYKLLQNEPSIEPHLTRTDDYFVTLSDRARIANELDAKLFISIHGNAFTNSDVRGTETYYWSERSKSLANTLHEHIVQTTQFPDRKVRNKNYKVLVDTNMPSVLLEIGYLSNEQDEAQMLNEQFQEQVAQSIAAAIKQYLNTN